jgi:hypothetical protein
MSKKKHPLNMDDPAVAKRSAEVEEQYITALQVWTIVNYVDGC